MKTIKHGSDIKFSPENDCTSRVMSGGEYTCQNSSRITFFDKKVTLKTCPSITDRNNQGGYDVYTDDWKTSSNQANEFWTGKTVFCYGQDGPDKFKQFAMASKARPGPHRDKREAKKEAKASKFRGVDQAVKSKAEATKDTRRTNSPAPKKGKEPNAAPCFIDPHPKFACIAEKQPRVTSSSEGSSVSIKRVRFRKIPQVIEVTAVGRQVPVRHRPREFTNVYRTSGDVPVSSKVEQHEAQVRARQLQETVKLHDSDVAPSCGFCCWNEDTCDITCKECRLVSGPKALRDVGRFPSIPTAAPKAGVSWLVDSGSESDLVSKGMLRDVSAKNCRAAEHPISLVAAKRSTEANEVADVKLSALPDPRIPCSHMC